MRFPLPPREREGTRAEGVGRVRGGARILNRTVPWITPHPSHGLRHGPLPSPGAGEGTNRPTTPKQRRGGWTPRHRG
ncbi:hypothetical protein EI613_04235 [Azospirillum sp. 412522]|nr:hypothetical protein [Azospirillum sp. 412522]